MGDDKRWCVHLEGRMGKNRVRVFIPKAGKKSNERVKVSSDS